MKKRTGTVRIVRSKADQRKIRQAESLKTKDHSNTPVCRMPAFRGIADGHTIYLDNGWEAAGMMPFEKEGETYYFRLRRRIIHQVWVWHHGQWNYEYRKVNA